MDYANPMYPNVGALSNVKPVSNLGPMAKTASSPYGHHQPYCGNLWTSAGVILVLFILLVIITRSWAV